MNIRSFDFLASGSINELNGLGTGVSFRSWSVRNVLNRNILTRFTRNRVYRFARITRFRVISWNVRNLTRSSFTWVIRTSKELRLWSIRDWLAIWVYWNDMTIWSVSNSNYSVRIFLNYCCPTGGCFCSSIALNYWSIDLAKSMVAS